MSNLLIMVDSFGFATFCAAFVFGMKNYKIFKGSRVLWAIFNITAFTAALWSLMSALRWMEIYPEILVELMQPLYFAIVVLLVTFVIAENEMQKL